jgi:hypothetical protein
MKLVGATGIEDRLQVSLVHFIQGTCGDGTYREASSLHHSTGGKKKVFILATITNSFRDTQAYKYQKKIFLYWARCKMHRFVNKCVLRSY